MTDKLPQDITDTTPNRAVTNGDLICDSTIYVCDSDYLKNSQKFPL